MQLRLKEAGIELVSDSVNDSKSNVDYSNKLDDFCNSVAICSQVKLSLPMSLALRMMGVPISSRNIELFHIISSMSFLIVSHADNDKDSYDFEVSFRTPLEADLHLQNAGVTPEKQIGYLVKMIQEASLAGSYNYNREINMLERLIHHVGPNSGNESLMGKYKPAYPLLIEALGDLRKNSIFEPKLICQEVTLIRKVYGKDGQIDVNIRVEKLIAAIEIARTTIKKLQKDMYNYTAKGAIDALIVESTFSELRLRDLSAGFKSQTNKILDISFDYAERYRQLRNVISHDQATAIHIMLCSICL